MSGLMGWRIVNFNLRSKSLLLFDFSFLLLYGEGSFLLTVAPTVRRWIWIQIGESLLRWVFNGDCSLPELFWGAPHKVIIFCSSED